MDIHGLREQVYKLIFSYDALRRVSADVDPWETIKNYLEYSLEEDLSPREERYIIKKALAVEGMIYELDKEIDEVAIGWTTRYMGKAELNILRLAVYEIRHDDKVPGKVAVNEAVELAKVYGGADSGSFVNGILKHFIKDEDKKVTSLLDSTEILRSSPAASGGRLS